MLDVLPAMLVMHRSFTVCPKLINRCASNFDKFTARKLVVHHDVSNTRQLVLHHVTVDVCHANGWANDFTCAQPNCACPLTSRLVVRCW